MSKLSIHREINSSIITFEQEVLMNVFYGLIKKFNKEIDKSIIEVTKIELWNLMGFKEEHYNSEKIKQVIKQLTKSNTYEISNNSKISGSVFVTEELRDCIRIEIPQTFRKYIFTQKDIDLIVKAKQNQKMDVEELDYWDTTLKLKKKSLVLLKEADIYNINGKYSKRLYTLLGQWKKSKKFEIKMDKFKEIMEIPESYKMSHINSKVLALSIKEIEEKTDIKNIRIEKIKNGRNIDKLIFTFTIKEPSEVNVEQTEVKENLEIKSELEILKLKIASKLAKSKNINLLVEFSNVSTEEKLKEFIKKHNLKID